MAHEPMTHEEYDAAVLACPNAPHSEGPFRYCPSCPWTEEGPLGGFSDPSLADAEAAFARAKEREGRAYDAWRDAVSVSDAAGDAVARLRGNPNG